MLPRSFTFINLRSPHLVFAMVMLTVVSLVFLGILGGKDFDSWLVGASLMLGLAVAWIRIQSRKIIIGPSGISFRTWRGGYTLSWEDVKVAGGILRYRNEYQFLSEGQMNEDDEWMGQKYIFVSTHSQRQLSSTPANDPGFIYFQYRPEAWDMIMEQINAKGQPRIRSFREVLQSDWETELRYRAN